MQRVLIYPYSEKYRWIFNNENIFKYFDSAVAIYPSKWDIGELNDERIKKEQYFQEEMEHCSYLWIVTSELDINFQKDIFTKLEYAAEHGVTIFYTRPYDEAEKNMIENVIPDKQWFGIRSCINEKKNMNEMFDIDTPVVDILSLSTELNSVEQWLNIRNCFRKAGYKVALLSDIQELEVLEDCYWISMLAESNNIKLSQGERIIATNHYIKQVEMDNNYDLFLIGNSKGTSTYGRKILEDLGINTYSISKSATPDYVILNIFFGYYDQCVMEELGRETESIIGCDIDFFNLTDKVVNIDKSESCHKICTFNVGRELALDKARSLPFDKAGCLLYDSEIKRLVNLIIKKLQGYTDISTI